MYYIHSKESDELYRVIDTEDDIVERYNINTLVTAFNRGVSIRGLDCYNGFYSFKVDYVNLKSIYRASSLLKVNPIELLESIEPNISKVITCKVNDKNNTIGYTTSFKSGDIALDCQEYSKYVDNMDNLFANSSYDYLNLKDFNTSNVISMKAMFACCNTNFINLSTFDTSHVESMQYMFDRCTARGIDLSTFTTKRTNSMCFMLRKTEAEYRYKSDKRFKKCFNN